VASGKICNHCEKQTRFQNVECNHGCCIGTKGGRAEDAKCFVAFQTASMKAVSPLDVAMHHA
jgi:hypothetical protein